MGISIVCALFAAAVVIVYWLPIKPERIGPKAGEQMLYRVYTGENYIAENQVGTFTIEVPRTTIYQGVKCYQATYLFTKGDTTRSGSMLFDERGRLRHYASFIRINDSIQWIAEINNYLILNKVNVKVVYPTLTVENEARLPINFTTAEHFLYLIRLEHLDSNYYKEFNFAYLPNAIQTTAVGARVAGEEFIEVPAGSYDCWVVDTSGGYVARAWVSKEEKVLAKFAEGNLIYELQQARYWQ